MWSTFNLCDWFILFIYCGGSGKGLGLAHRRLSGPQNAGAGRSRSWKGSDGVLWGWENERRGTIANVTDGVRVRAGTGTQGSSPGPLNQELFTERRKRPLFIKLSQVSCSCLASLILELLWKDPPEEPCQSQHTGGFLAVSPRSRQAVTEGLQQSRKLCKGHLRSYALHLWLQLQSEETGKDSCPFIFFLSLLSDESHDWVAPVDTEIQLP